MGSYLFGSFFFTFMSPNYTWSTKFSTIKQQLYTLYETL